MEDAQLLAAVARRDERAVEALHARFAPSIRAVALRVTGAEDSADEVTQDVLMAIWRDPGRFDPGRGSAVGFLLSMARNKAIDRVRREQTIRRHTAVVDLELTEAPQDVHREVWRTLREERLRVAINQLPDDQRRALEHAFLGGLTHVEVAAREGVALGTAKSRIRMALLKLRADIGSSLSERRDDDSSTSTAARNQPPQSSTGRVAAAPPTDVDPRRVSHAVENGAHE